MSDVIKHTGITKANTELPGHEVWHENERRTWCWATNYRVCIQTNGNVRPGEYKSPASEQKWWTMGSASSAQYSN